VPYDQVWRTGANEATTITFSDDVTVEGTKLPAGTYGLFTIPGKDEWTVVFNKGAKQWGAYEYKQADDVLRIKATPHAVDAHELLTFIFPTVATESATVAIVWEKLAVRSPSRSTRPPRCSPPPARRSRTEARRLAYELPRRGVLPRQQCKPRRGQDVARQVRRGQGDDVQPRRPGPIPCPRRQEGGRDRASQEGDHGRQGRPTPRPTPRWWTNLLKEWEKK